MALASPAEKLLVTGERAGECAGAGATELTSGLASSVELG
jgi:hypothetical protein